MQHEIQLPNDLFQLPQTTLSRSWWRVANGKDQEVMATLLLAGARVEQVYGCEAYITLNRRWVGTTYDEGGKCVTFIRVVEYYKLFNMRVRAHGHCLLA